jgi:hypothetical protein
MVLKFLALIILLNIKPVFAQRKPQPQSLYLQAAQKAYLKKNYKKSLSILKQKYPVQSPAKLSSNVLNLLALNYFKLKQYKESARYFHAVINRDHQKIHPKIIKAQEKGNLEAIEVPKTLLLNYYHLGQIYYQLYLETENTSYYNASEKFFKILEDKEYLDENASKFLAGLASKKSAVEKRHFQTKWFITSGVMNWQEKIMLENAATKNTIKLLSNARAICYGGGFRYSNAYHGFEVQACGFSGSANISANNPSLYAQTGVAVQGLIIDSGYTIKSSYEKASLTFALPLFYRDGDYSQPNGYTILGKAQLSAGLMLKARLELPYFDLITSFGNLGATNITSLGLGYTF